MTQHQIIDKIDEMRRLVEDVLDVSIVFDKSGYVSRTAEGQKLVRVLFGLDIIRKGIKDSET